MKKLVYILIVLTTLAFTTKVIVYNTSVLITSDSELVIKGTTNINSFQCKFNIKEINKPIPLFYKVVDDRIVFEKAKLVLDNECFDCGNNGMNRDFMKLLKSDEYPEIELQLKEVNKNNGSQINALLELRIAGKSKSYHVPIAVKDKEDIFVSGTLKVDITDFNLEAPKKALGLIVVSDYVEISFQLNFKESK
jgi:hypothetical protein